MQSEQFRLTRILHDQLRGRPGFSIAFDAPVVSVRQDETGVEIELGRQGASVRRTGRWLIGADGARSAVRRSLEIEFEGFTWPERFLVVSTPFDFSKVIPDLAPVSYVADPQRWHFLLQIPGFCRVMFPVRRDESDQIAVRPAFVESLMSTIVPGLSGYEVAHVTLYEVHQRVAKTFRLGRVLLAGDAAHINNPLGGMGMNGGIHDAINLTTRLAEVWHGISPDIKYRNTIGSADWLRSNTFKASRYATNATLSRTGSSLGARYAISPPTRYARASIC